MGALQPTHLLLILLVIVLLFGGSRVASLGKGIGEGIKNFKEGLRDDDGSKEAKEKDSSPQTRN
jgi:sec-independent protein translocase protein TatA